MVTTVPLRCQCGKVRGVATDVSAATGTRVGCCCDDCQAFAHHLGRSDVLDAFGGTDIFQMPPSHIRITEGATAVRCIRLTAKGMIRWYTDCCRTPIGNTISGRIPFVGVIHSFMDHAATGRSRDETLGEPLAYVQGRFAVGEVPAHVHRTAPLGLIVRSVGLLLKWKLTGQGHRG